MVTYLFFIIITDKYLYDMLTHDHVAGKGIAIIFGDDSSKTVAHVRLTLLLMVGGGTNRPPGGI